MSELPIEEYFKYHPPLTEDRKAKHNSIIDILPDLKDGVSDPNY